MFLYSFRAILQEALSFRKVLPISMARIKINTKQVTPKAEKGGVTSPKPDIKKVRKAIKDAKKIIKEEPDKIEENLTWGICESCNEKQWYRAGQASLKYSSCVVCTGSLVPIPHTPAYSPSSPSYTPSSPYESDDESEVKVLEAGDSIEHPIVIPLSPIYVADSDSE